MKADIIAVGNRDIYSSFFNAGFDYLQNELRGMDISMRSYKTLRSEPSELFSALEDAITLSDLIVILSSPEPDSARTVSSVLSQGFGLPLETDDGILADVAFYASRTGKNLSPDEIASFCSFPQGARIISNPDGLVQGYAFTARRQIMLVLPASPSELTISFAPWVKELIQNTSGGNTACVSARVLELENFSVREYISSLHLTENPRVSCSGDNGDYEIIIEAGAKNKDDARKICSDILQKIKMHFGTCLYCEGSVKIDRIVSSLLKEKALTVAAAESSSETALRSILESSAESENYFLGGILAQDVRSKAEKLFVPKPMLAHYGQVNRRIAAAMAIGVRKRFGSNLGAAVTYGLSGGEATAFVAVADSSRTWVKKLNIDPSQSGSVSHTAALQALNMLRLYAIQYPQIMPGYIKNDRVMNTSDHWREKLLIPFTALPFGKKSASIDVGVSNEPSYMKLYNPTRIPKEKIARPVCRNAATNDKTSSPAKPVSSELSLSPKSKIVGETKSPLDKPRSVFKKQHKSSDKTDNLFIRLKNKTLSKNDKIRLGVLVLCLLVFLACIAYLISYRYEAYYNKKITSEIQTLYPGAGGTASSPSTDTDDDTQEDEEPPDRNVPEGYPERYMESFVRLYQTNSDIAGWVSIPDTALSYAVVQTENNTDYDRVDFYKKANNHGIPFVDFRVDQFLPSTNTIIYGHNMGDGQMFGELMKYKTLSFYKQHPIINYDSVYYEGVFKIFAFAICRADDEDFLYHNFIEPETDAQMREWIAKIKERSLVNTTVDVVPGDILLTLSTCDYSFRDENGEQVARFALFARKLRPGESADVNVADAKLNTNPVMPKEWYSYLAKKQAAELEAQRAAEELASYEKWLTLFERDSLSAEAKKSTALERKSAAEALLLPEEIADLSADDLVSILDSRKAIFNKWLSESDRALKDVASKLEKAESNSALA